MVEKSRLRRGFTFKVVILAFLLSLLITGVAYAVLENHKLSGGNISGGDVIEFKISPNGRYTVFKGDLNTNDQNDLFSVLTLGGERVLLSQDLREDCYVDIFLISPDSQYVVYSTMSISLSIEFCGLYSVPIEGGTPIELDHADFSRVLNEFVITGDTEYVLFNFEYQSSLYRVPLEGGDRLEITEEILGVMRFQITPDNQAVVVSLYPFDGRPDRIIHYDLAADVSTPLVEFGPGDDLGYARLNPDGAYVIYTMVNSEHTELYSLAIDGESPVTLNGSLPPGGNVKQFQIAPDSANVVYRADEIVDEEDQLFRVSVDGSDHDNLTPWPLGTQTTFKISPDSQWVVYRSDQDIPDKLDLYSVPIAGGFYNELTPGMRDFGDVTHYEITPNSHRVVFTADGWTDEMYELYGILINGEDVRRLNPNLPDGGDVYNFRISANSNGIVYRADQYNNDDINLYAIPSAGGVPPLRVNPNTDRIYKIIPNFLITPDDKGVVYIADQDLDEVNELFITYDYQKLYLPMVTR